MSASLIGRLGSSAFRLSAITPRAKRLELKLLLIAQGCIEILKCRAHQLDRTQHGVEPFAEHRRRPAGLPTPLDRRPLC
jgi:hypothetical protein